jgi:cysteine desulfurase
MALKGFRALHGHATRLITSTVEHPAVLNTVRFLREQGASTAEIGVDEQGLLRMDELDSIALDSHTLLSFMWGNNETGVLFPIEELANKAKAQGAFLHTDAVQAVGKVPIDLSRIPLDFLALSGHKLHAPKGIGATFIRRGTKLPPLLHGGHQEDGVRAGTENVPYIVGLGVACELARAGLEDENVRVRALRDRLEQELLARCKGAQRNGHPTLRLPNTTNISFEFIEGEAVLLLLDELGVAASSGSACTTGSLEPSHVMRAMGVPYTLAHSSTRFSLSRYTTAADIELVLAEMPGIVEKLREMSPFVTGDA